jgi:hypothetical protein
LGIREAVFGPNTTDVATVINNLAAIYEAQGRSEELETYAKRALAIVTKTLGPNNPDTAKVIRKLGVAYDAQRRSPMRTSVQARDRHRHESVRRITASLPACCSIKGSVQHQQRCDEPESLQAGAAINENRAGRTVERHEPSTTCALSVAQAGPPTRSHIRARRRLRLSACQARPGERTRIGRIDRAAGLLRKSRREPRCGRARRRRARVKAGAGVRDCAMGEPVGGRGRNQQLTRVSHYNNALATLVRQDLSAYLRDRESADRGAAAERLNELHRSAIRRQIEDSGASSPPATVGEFPITRAGDQAVEGRGCDAGCLEITRRSSFF